MCLKHEAVITVSAPRMVSNRDNGGATFWTKTDFRLKWPTTPAGSHYSTETFCSWLWASPLNFFFNWKPEISSPSMTHIRRSERLPHGGGWQSWSPQPFKDLFDAKAEGHPVSADLRTTASPAARIRIPLLQSAAGSSTSTAYVALLEHSTDARTHRLYRLLDTGLQSTA